MVVRNSFFGATVSPVSSDCVCVVEDDGDGDGVGVVVYDDFVCLNSPEVTALVLLSPVGLALADGARINVSTPKLLTARKRNELPKSTWKK